MVEKGYNIHGKKDANDNYVYNGIENTVLLTMTMTKAAISTAPKLQMSQQEND